MPRQENKQSFLGGAAILGVAVILVKIIGAVYKIPLNNILGDEGVTYFNAAYKIYAFLLSLSTAGLPVALSKMVAESRALGKYNQSRKLLGLSLALFTAIGAAGTAVMFFFTDELAALMHNSLAYYPIKALSFSVVCVCVMSAFRGYAQGCENMVPTAVSQVLEAAFKLVVGLALAWYLVKIGAGLDMGAAGAILGVTVSTVAALVYMVFNHLRHRRALPDSGDAPAPSSALLKRLLSIGIPITIGASGMSLISLIDQSLIMGRLQSVLGLSEQAAAALNGQYEFSMTLFNLPSSFIPPITMSLIPAVSAALTMRDSRRVTRLVNTSMRLTTLLAMPAGVGLSVLAGPILILLYPAQHDAAVAAAYHLRLLGIASIFVCIVLLTNAILQAYGHSNIPIITMFTGGVVKVAANYLLVGNPDINIKGAPIGTLLCYLVITLLNLYFIRKYSPAKASLLRLLVKPAFASALMGGAAWAACGFLGRFLSGRLSSYLANAVSTLAGILAGAAVYFVLVIALRILAAEDVKNIKKGDVLIRVLHLK